MNEKKEKLADEITKDLVDLPQTEKSEKSVDAKKVKKEKEVKTDCKNVFEHMQSKG